MSWHRGLFCGKVNLQKALHGIAVVNSIFDALVGKTEPVLHEVHAQHRFQWNQFSAALFLDIERRNKFHPFFPGNDGIHGIQKGFPPCYSFAVCIFHVRKCLLHDFVSLPHRIASSPYCNLSETKHATKEFISGSLRINP